MAAPAKHGRLALRQSAGSPSKLGSPMRTRSSLSSHSSVSPSMRKPSTPHKASTPLHLGWFSKYTPRYSGWKRRFVVLKGGELLNYKSITANVRGGHPYRKRGAVRVAGWRELPGLQHAVLVKASPTDIMLQADSAEQLRQLTDAIDAALDSSAPSASLRSPHGDAVSVGGSPLVPPPPPPPDSVHAQPNSVPALPGSVHAPPNSVPAPPAMSGLASPRVGRASTSVPLEVSGSRGEEGDVGGPKLAAGVPEITEVGMPLEGIPGVGVLSERGELGAGVPSAGGGGAGMPLGVGVQLTGAQVAGVLLAEKEGAGCTRGAGHMNGSGVVPGDTNLLRRGGLGRQQSDRVPSISGTGTCGEVVPKESTKGGRVLRSQQATGGDPLDLNAPSAIHNERGNAAEAAPSPDAVRGAPEARLGVASPPPVPPLALAAHTGRTGAALLADGVDPSLPPVHEGLARGLAQVDTLESVCNRMTPRGSEFAARPSQHKLGIDDFQVQRVLGRGAFAHVALAKSKETGRSYAIKSLNKRMLVAKYQVEATVTERDILRHASGHPFIVGLHAAFSSELHLHLVLDYLPGGDLQTRLMDSGRLPHAEARLFTAELSLALSCVHDECQAIYRDLKPSNVLLDAQGHAVLADFGLSKLAPAGTSFCGTAEYIAPEAMRRSEYDKTVDWWALGVVLHELLTGHTPFTDRSIPAVQRNILEATPLPPAAPPGIEIMPDAASLIAELLQRDPSARLGRGADGTARVQAHPFFGSLDFGRVRQRGYPPAWTPPLEGRLRKSFRDSHGDLLQALPPDEIDEDLPGYSSGSSSAHSDAETGTALPDPRFLGFSFVQ